MATEIPRHLIAALAITTIHRHLCRQRARMRVRARCRLLDTVSICCRPSTDHVHIRSMKWTPWPGVRCALAPV